MADAKDEARIRHMIDSAQLIAQYIEGVLEEDFIKDIQLQDSVIRRLEIIGEAASHVDEEMKEQNPEIAWRKAAGMRNILAHEYFDVDPLSVWVTASEYVPELERQLRSLLSE